jgi:hypothetical protein
MRSQGWQRWLATNLGRSRYFRDTWHVRYDETLSTLTDLAAYRVCTVHGSDAATGPVTDELHASPTC